ncbi:hypothetical protein LZG74_13105 [Dyadobacter sp. CY327]|uniref:hypothetical protein n=1 Tax=Dyadobacter sp. CY327 TaxID=2907301 RepID=UPI001F40A891|nr:hypothetical protein [Dyadobacter sp. CY327]MCE7071250.1 hypothetical protein [Dyadobacter sp. CY327]
MLRLAVPSSKEKRTILNFLSRKARKKAVAEMDATEYLMSNPVNRDYLLKAIDDVENGRNIFYRDLIEP